MDKPYLNIQRKYGFEKGNPLRKEADPDDGIISVSPVFL